MDNRTPAQKKNAARKHHLAGLYHNAFLTTSQPVLGVDIDAHDANKLVRNGWAMIHVFGTKVVLGKTQTGAKHYGSNCIFTVNEYVHAIARYSNDHSTRVDMSALMNMCSRLSPLYMKKWY